MYCTKCGAKIENDEKFCNSCGSLRANKYLNKSRLLILIGIVILCIVSFVGYTKHKEKVELESMQNIANLIAESSVNCGQMIEEISSTWTKAIEESTRRQLSDDIYDMLATSMGTGQTPEEAISELINKKWSISEKLEKRKSEKLRIEEELKSFKDTKNVTVYDKLTEYYLVYEKVYFAATSPSGSLLSYNTDVGRIFTDLKEKQTRLELALSSK